MASILEQKLKNKKTEIKDIDRKIQSEQITPTTKENHTDNFNPIQKGTY